MGFMGIWGLAPALLSLFSAAFMLSHVPDFAILAPVTLIVESGNY